jgi:hypothetical protein
MGKIARTVAQNEIHQTPSISDRLAKLGVTDDDLFAGRTFVQEFVAEKMSPELLAALKISANQEMFRFEIGRAFDKIIQHGHKSN